MGTHLQSLKSNLQITKTLEKVKMNLIRLSLHGNPKLLTTNTRSYKIFDLYKQKYGPQKTLVGQCPIYGHKYYEMNPQTYGFFKQSTFKTYKRECDWNFGDGVDANKLTEHEKYWKAQELISKTLFTPEWDRWLKMKKRDAPKDQEIINSMAKKQSIAQKGKMIEDRYNKIKVSRQGMKVRFTHRDFKELDIHK